MLLTVQAFVKRAHQPVQHALNRTLARKMVGDGTFALFIRSNSIGRDRTPT